MKHLNILFLALCLLISGASFAQVGIGTTSPNSSAVLDLSSSSKGLLIPRMTSSQRTSISSPATGLIVFDTDSGYVFYYSSSWKGIKNSGGSTTNYWARSGTNTTLANSGDNVGIGKTPSYNLDVNGLTNSDSFGIGGSTVLKTKGTRNVNVGKSAGKANTAADNVFVGYQAGLNNSIGDENVFVGSSAGEKNTSGYGNVFTGIGAGYSNTSGAWNMFSGRYAGYSNTTGHFNVFTGASAGYYNTSGYYNVFSGYGAGLSNTTGSNNVFSGDGAGNSNTTASNNVFVGSSAGITNTTGNNNVFIGNWSGYNNLTAGGNSFIGNYSGVTNTTGKHNTLLGDSADVNSSNLSNATAIGYNAHVSTSNSMVLGNGVNVGIGTSSPASTAILDLTSTTQGLLIPRMTSSQRTSISSPATGLIVFDTDSGYVFYYSSSWKGIKNSGGSTTNYWARSGTSTTLANSGDKVGIGKTPSYNLDVKGLTNADSFGIGGSTVLNTKGTANTLIGNGAGSVNTGSYNSFSGYQAAYSNTTGSWNTFSGAKAGYSNTTGIANVFTGYYSGYLNTTGSYNSFFGGETGSHNTTGSYNIFTGFYSGNQNTTGNFNIFIGYGAGYYNTTGSANVFTGLNAGVANTTGSYNTFSGDQAGYANTTGNSNVFTGFDAGFNTTTGFSNNFFGYQTGYSNTTGAQNIFAGFQSGFSNTTGQGNTSLGNYAGYSNTTGNHNTLLGDSADVSSGTLSNATAIGYNAHVSSSNSMVLGNGVNVGIGTSSPASTAILDLTSTSRGLLIPRMTSSQRTSISSPATGLEVYDTDSGYAFFYSGSAWKGTKTYTASNGITSLGTTIKLGGNLSAPTTIGTSSTNTLTLTGVQSGSSSDSLMVLSSGVVKKVAISSIGSVWTHSGSTTTLVNSGDNVGIGKTPSYDLDVSGLTNSDSFGMGGATILKNKGTRNIFVGKNTAPGNTGTDNAYVGFQAGMKNSSGYSNTFLGSSAGESNSTGFNNVFLGAAAGYKNTTGSHNNFSGAFAGYTNTSGTANIFSGYSAGYSNTIGEYNNFSGVFAGYTNTSGSANMFSGYSAGFSNTTGDNNVFTGFYSGYSNTTGDNNVFTGFSSGIQNTTGNSNIFVGYNTGYYNTTGSQNIYMGYQAGYSNTSGGNNIAMGYQAGLNISTGDGNLCFGEYAGASTTSGYSNVYVGVNAGFSGTTAAYNSYIGQGAGYYTTTGSNNVFSGYRAAYGNTTGYENVMLGKYSGYTNTTGHNNVIIGDSANVGSSGLSNAIAIGSNAIVSSSNSMVLGNGVNVGVGTSSPNTTSILDLTSTSKGLLIPRMTSSQRTSISSPATGLQVFDTDSGYLFFYNSGWKGIKSSGAMSATNYWSRSGSNTTLANSSDKVGIGKTPTYDLDISGLTNSDSFGIAGKTILKATGTRNLFLGMATGTNNTGTGHVFSGYQAGYSNTNGNYNIFSGYQAGYSNNIGENNVYLGYQAGYSTTKGYGNVYLGAMAGYTTIGGKHNVVIGDSADVNAAGVGNAVALGYGATALSSNSMAFGNSSVLKWGFGAATPSSTQVFIVGTGSTNGNGAYLTAGGTWTNASDVNLKENFSNLDGADVLNKISKLNITRWMYKGTENEYHIGPMAQDFHAAFNVGVNNRSISTIDPAGVALIGVQELKKQNDELKEKNAELENKLKGMDEMLKQVRDAQIACCRQLGNLEQAAVLDVPVLGQNTPNPFPETTVIKYYLPLATASASIIITDMSGKTLQSFKLEQNGNGQILVGGNALASGTYNYTLILNGAQVDTKRMVITK